MVLICMNEYMYEYMYEDTHLIQKGQRGQRGGEHTPTAVKSELQTAVKQHPHIGKQRKQVKFNMKYDKYKRE